MELYWTEDFEYDMHYIIIDKYELIISEDSDSVLIWDNNEKVPCDTIPLISINIEENKIEAIQVFINWIKKDIENKKDIIKKCIKLNKNKQL